MALIEFIMAMTDTPTSANTASHIFERPTALSMSTSIFTARAKIIFCLTIDVVFLAILRARAILEGLSSISTMSAASMAASEPIPPMAMPTSALEREGASFMPSPTNTVLPDEVLIISSSHFTLSAGRSSAYTVSMPASRAVF